MGLITIILLTVTVNIAIALSLVSIAHTRVQNYGTWIDLIIPHSQIHVGGKEKSMKV